MAKQDVPFTATVTGTMQIDLGATIPPVEPPDTALPPPENLRVSDIGSTTATIEWDFNDTDEYHYAFTMHGAAGMFDKEVTIPGFKRSQRLSDLPPDTEITIKMKAFPFG